MKIKSLLPFILLLSSCTNFMIRQECDKLNWYQHGQDVAMRGERLSNDDMVMKCRRAEADVQESKLDQGFKAGMNLYCQPDIVFQTGKRGENFNPDFCDTSNMNLLKKRHADGILGYCKAGMTAGLSGKKYGNVCTAEQETTFMPEYRKGRKKYLSSLLVASQSKKAELNNEINRISYEKRTVDNRMSMLPNTDAYINERQSLSNRAWSLNSDISRVTSERAKIEKEIDDYQKELATLD